MPRLELFLRASLERCVCGLDVCVIDVNSCGLAWNVVLAGKGFKLCGKFAAYFYDVAFAHLCLSPNGDPGFLFLPVFALADLY